MLPYKTGTVRVTSPYGRRFIFGYWEMHRGIDLVGDAKDKTVRAVADGTIARSMIVTDPSNRTSQWGNYVRLDLSDGQMIYYCHLARRLVKTGQKVKAGDPIGIEGSTGKVTGAHLHFEVRKNGVSIDPTGILGIPNQLGSYNTEKETAKAQYPDEYEHDGLTFVRCKNFKILYWDKKKKSGNYSRYINGGFFGGFKDGQGRYFTLPVANLCCDIDAVPAIGGEYIKPHIVGKKLYIGCNDNQIKQLHGRKVSTLIVPATGKPYITDCNDIPANCKYAISGIPTVRNGDDVDYYKYVKGEQGWDESPMYATYRHWLAVRDGEIWLITGRTYTRNYIYGMEMWKKIRGEHFDDVIAIDGGGSYYYKNGSKSKTTFENRQVNTIITF